MIIKKTILCLKCEKDVEELILAANSEGNVSLVCKECLIKGLREDQFDFLETRKNNCGCLEKMLFEIYEKSQKIE